MLIMIAAIFWALTPYYQTVSTDHTFLCLILPNVEWGKKHHLHFTNEHAQGRQGGKVWSHVAFQVWLATLRSELSHGNRQGSTTDSKEAFAAQWSSPSGTRVTRQMLMGPALQFS